jgi:hypothetical protein
MNELTIDAHTLTLFQGCRRRFLLDHDYRAVLWRPHSLFSACLRAAILELSKGADVAETAIEARARFMQTAANPGMDAQGDTYTLAKDYCCLLDTVLRAVAHEGVPKLSEVPPTRLNSSLAWRFLSHIDDSGTLHRWITVDSWTEADLARELHGWYVFGDMAMAQALLTLHVIVIGQTRGGRRASLWARAWQHPSMPNLRIRFRRSEGQSFNGWKPYRMADHPDVDPDAWVEQMYKEGAAQELMHTVKVKLPTADILSDTARQVMQEARAMQELALERGSTTWMALPMSRGVCDGLVPCPFQPVCYSSQVIDIETLGLFQARRVSTVSA